MVRMRGAAEKLEAAEGQLSAGGRVGRYAGGAGGGGGAKSGSSGAEQQLARICCDANKVALEQVKGISGQVRAGVPPFCSLPRYPLHVTCFASLSIPSLSLHIKHAF
jgi:hypothetical protein